MIYITGDTHSNVKRFNSRNFPEQSEMTRDDHVIICGDFGLVWEAGAGSKNEDYWLDWLEEKSYTTLFIDGNHENFDRLNCYPVKEWHGGLVHEIRPHVLHLMRGQVFEIDGKKIFAFGGAKSHDIQAGILDPEDPDFKKKKKLLDRDYALYRIKNVTWWEAETATREEMDEGLNNLKKHGYKVDFIITHCAPSSLHVRFNNGKHEPDQMTEYLEKVRSLTDYGKWYFGHYHDEIKVSDKEELVYKSIIRMN